MRAREYGGVLVVFPALDDAGGGGGHVFGGRFQDFRQAGGGGAGADGLGDPALVPGEQPGCGVDDADRAAVVHFEGVVGGAGEVLVVVDQEARVGAGVAVDDLVVVADAVDLPGGTRQQAHQQQVGRGQFLELVENASRCRTLGNLATFAAQQEPWIAGQLEEFERDLRLVGRARDVPQALKILREHVGLGLALEELDHDAAASHLDDLVALEQTARLHPDWATFEGWLHDALEQKGKCGVRLSTVHRVKGMEWDHVIVYGAQKGLWPHRLADDVEEERRVFHVAITRARKDVVIIADTDHPSKFVKELKVSKKVTWGPEALAAAQQLREPERGVFLARHKEGLDIPVIAQRMGKSESAVRTWLQLAERDLRQRLD